MYIIVAGGSTTPSVSATFAASSGPKSSSGSFRSQTKSWCFSNMCSFPFMWLFLWWTESFCWAASTADPTAWFASLAQSGFTLTKRRTEENQKLDFQPWNEGFGSGTGATQSRRCLRPPEVILKVFHRASKAAQETRRRKIWARLLLMKTNEITQIRIAKNWNKITSIIQRKRQITITSLCVNKTN